MEDKYERQHNSYNMFQYTSKVMYIYCLYLYTTKRHPNLMIVFKSVIHHITIESIDVNYIVTMKKLVSQTLMMLV